MEKDDNTGWVSLHRKIQENWIYPTKENRPFTRFEAWMDLLLNANHTEQKVVIKNKVYICKRGDQLRSLETLSKKWLWTRSMIHRFLHFLQNDSMIVLKPDTKTTQITICNYDKYQGERNANETRMKHERNTDETRAHINNNDLITINNEKNDNNPKGENNFFESLVFLFKDVYSEINGIPYAINEKKDFPAAAELVNVIKAETGITEEEKLTEYFQGYFKQIINHPDNFYKTRMTLPFLANNFNTINNIYKNKSGTFTKSEWERILKHPNETWDNNPPSSPPDPDTPPTFKEIEQYFKANGYNSQAAKDANDKFHKWNWKGNTGINFIPQWKERAKELYFTGGIYYKPEYREKLMMP